MNSLRMFTNKTIRTSKIMGITKLLLKVLVVITSLRLKLALAMLKEERVQNTGEI